MAEAKTIKLQNETKTVVVAGQIRIKPGEILEIKKDRCPEGLRRIIGKELKEVK